MSRFFGLTSRGRALSRSAKNAHVFGAASRGARSIRMPGGRPNLGGVNFDSFAKGGGRRGRAAVPRRLPTPLRAPAILPIVARANATNVVRSAAGVPMVPFGISQQAARQSASRVVMSAMGGSFPAPRAAPRISQAQNARSAATKGKGVSRAVLGAAVGIPVIGAFRNNTGPAADRSMGRPTGPYNY